MIHREDIVLQSDPDGNVEVFRDSDSDRPLFIIPAAFAAQVPAYWAVGLYNSGFSHGREAGAFAVQHELRRALGLNEGARREER